MTKIFDAFSPAMQDMLGMGDFAVCDFQVVESGRTVRLARFKFDSPSSATTHTVETTMACMANLTHFLITPVFATPASIPLFESL